jgi:ribonuclease HII
LRKKPAVISLLQYIFRSWADEAGRGCLAGPVTAARWYFLKLHYSLLNDSKKNYPLKNRNELRPIIQEESCPMRNTSWTCNYWWNQYFECINKSHAGMRIKIKSKPLYVIIDGNSPFYLKLELKSRRFTFQWNWNWNFNTIPSACIIKGAKYQSIAAASILAKTSSGWIHEPYSWRISYVQLE